jgi:hypothetical protein
MIQIMKIYVIIESNRYTYGLNLSKNRFYEKSFGLLFLEPLGFLKPLTKDEKRPLTKKKHEKRKRPLY